MILPIVLLIAASADAAAVPRKIKFDRPIMMQNLDGRLKASGFARFDIACDENDGTCTLHLPAAETKDPTVLLNSLESERSVDLKIEALVAKLDNDSITPAEERALVRLLIKRLLKK